VRFLAYMYCYQSGSTDVRVHENYAIVRLMNFGRIHECRDLEKHGRIALSKWLAVITSVKQYTVVVHTSMPAS